MNSQIVAALLTVSATLGVPAIRALSRMTVQARAESQLHRADLFRRAGIDDEAAHHVRRARQFLLRPAVMEARGLVGTIAKADLMALALLIAGGTVAIVGNVSLAASFTGGGLTLGAIALMLFETVAVDRECTLRAASYDPPPVGLSTHRSRHRFLDVAALAYSLLRLVR